MSYHIYTTKGLVLSERPMGENDRIYNILTRDLGLVRARALAVRKPASKLRGTLEPFTLAQVSLVRGKEYWRVTSAEFIRKIPREASIARPLALLEKLVQGEAVQPELFDCIEESLDSGEVSIVSRILYQLGYLKKSDLNLPEKGLVRAINQGLYSSHLT